VKIDDLPWRYARMASNVFKIESELGTVANGNFDDSIRQGGPAEVSDPGYGGANALGEPIENVIRFGTCAYNSQRIKKDSYSGVRRRKFDYSWDSCALKAMKYAKNFA
jgi:hypothetical protein